MTAQQPIISTHGLSVGYRSGKRETVVLSQLDLSLRRGELVCLLGPNGIGKSTLLRTLSGVQPPLAGNVMVDGRDVASYTPRQLSKMISIVYTDRTLAGALTVSELVSLGRHPYTGFFGHLDDNDRAVIARALSAVGMQHKADCYVGNLSDGERQKAMIARALAQEAPIIILDEPTAFLDVASRIETMKNLHCLARQENKAILLSSHDVSQSLALASALWLLRSDGTMVGGMTEELVLNGELNRLFDGRDVVFDASIGDFAAAAEFAVFVRLVCPDDTLRHWMENLLYRNGIGVSDTADTTVTALSPSEITVGGVPATLQTLVPSILR